MNGDGLHAPRRLERHDATENFHSGAEDLDDWLARLAWQNQRSRDTVTYVSTQDGEILGYYAIAMASYARDEAPGGLGHRSRPAQLPCVLLARLAVERRAQGLGLGAATRLHAPSILRTATFSRRPPTRCTCYCR